MISKRSRVVMGANGTVVLPSLVTDWLNNKGNAVDSKLRAMLASPRAMVSIAKEAREGDVCFICEAPGKVEISRGEVPWAMVDFTRSYEYRDRNRGEKLLDYTRELVGVAPEDELCKPLFLCMQHYEQFVGEGKRPITFVMGDGIAVYKVSLYCIRKCESSATTLEGGSISVADLVGRAANSEGLQVYLLDPANYAMVRTMWLNFMEEPIP